MATNTDLIQQLYVAYFNRPADVAGLNYWVNAMSNGATVDQISAQFSVQPEYTSLFAGKQPDEIVNTIYLNLFGRGAEQAGLDYWGGKLQAGLVSVADIVKQVAAGATTTDLTAYNNKVTAAEAFTTELSTTGNEAERVAYASGTNGALQAAKTWLAGVTDDASLATAVAGVHAAAQQVVTAGTPVINTTLTAGTDTLVGGSGNDVFAGSHDTTSTWTGLDSIDGGAGVNTLNLSDVAGGIDLSLGTVKNVQNLNVTSTAGLAGDAADVSGFTGLTAATFSLKKAAVEVITAADTTAVTVTNTLGGVTVKGGSSINVTADTGSAVLATTNAALASATINGGSTVDITDASTDSNVLTTVSLKGNTGAATLTGNALTKVAISTVTTAADTTIVNTAAHTEDVTVTKVTGTTTITDANATTFNLHSATTKSVGITVAAAAATAVTLDAGVDLTVAALTAGLATGVTIKGAGKLTVTADTLDSAVAIDATAATGTVTITQALTTDQKYTGGAAVDSISIADTSKAITTGAGDDTVTLTSPTLSTGGSVDAGDGSDTLAGTSVVISGVNAATAAKLAHFETLEVTNALANAASFDVSAFSGVTNFTAASGVATGGTAHVVNLGASGNVVLAGDLGTNNGTLDIGTKVDGTADVVNLTINHSYLDNNDTTADPVAVTATVTTSTSIETLNVNSTATDTLSATTVTGYKADVVTNTLALTDDALVNLNVTGDRAFVFASAATMTALASIDASANTGGATIDASLSAASSAALTIKGSLTAANTLTGGAANDTITGGAKADTITGGAGGDTLTGGGGNDTFKFVAGDSSIGTGTFDTIKDFVANTYGNGTNGAAGTGASTDPTKVTGDILSFVEHGTGADGVIVDVLGSAADATTFLANHTGVTYANTVVAALDSSGSNLYVDNTGDGVADFYIHLTGVTTITAAAFTVHA